MSGTFESPTTKLSDYKKQGFSNTFKIPKTKPKVNTDDNNLDELSAQLQLKVLRTGP